MEITDVLAGDSINSDNDLTPNSSIVNEMPMVHESNNPQSSNQTSAPTTFMNHERKRSISNVGNNNVPNNEHFWNRSSFSSNEGGDKPNRPNKQEVNC